MVEQKTPINGREGAEPTLDDMFKLWEEWQTLFGGALCLYCGHDVSEHYSPRGYDDSGTPCLSAIWCRACAAEKRTGLATCFAYPGNLRNPERPADLLANLG